jgi:DNA-binding LytR/AlgR family response regulator
MLRINYSILDTDIKKTLTDTITKVIKDIQITDTYFDILFYEANDMQNTSVLQTLLSNNPNAFSIIIGPETSDSMQEYYALQTIGYLRNNNIETDFNKLLPNLLDTIKKHFQVYDVHSKRGMYKIRVNSIYYIESFRNNITIHAKSGSYNEYKSLKKFVAEIDFQQFLQVHKSYIVNTDNILEIKSHTIILKNHQEIPIGRAYKTMVSEHYIVK